MSNRPPAAWALDLARLMRWPIVVSGTRNALAISRVDNPPTALSVSGIDDEGVSEGWQHMNINSKVSSWLEDGPGGSIDHEAARASRRLRASERLKLFAMRRLAARTSHPRGLSGHPSTGHVVAATSRAS